MSSHDEPPKHRVGMRPPGLDSSKPVCYQEGDEQVRGEDKAELQGQPSPTLFRDQRLDQLYASTATSGSSKTVGDMRSYFLVTVRRVAIPREKVAPLRASAQLRCCSRGGWSGVEALTRKDQEAWRATNAGKVCRRGRCRTPATELVPTA
jgi:hypothetical protein